MLTWSGDSFSLSKDSEIFAEFISLLYLLCVLISSFLGKMCQSIHFFNVIFDTFYRSYSLQILVLYQRPGIIVGTRGKLNNRKFLPLLKNALQQNIYTHLVYTLEAQQNIHKTTLNLKTNTQIPPKYFTHHQKELKRKWLHLSGLFIIPLNLYIFYHTCVSQGNILFSICQHLNFRK